MNNHKDITKLLGWLAVVGPLHMTEQMLFGLDELAELKPLYAKYYSLFANPDFATVLLVTIVGAIFFFWVYAAAAGGRLLTGTSAFFALICLGEVHHVLKALGKTSYNPGVITAIPFMAIGVLLFRAIMHMRTTQPVVARNTVATGDL